MADAIAISTIGDYLIPKLTSITFNEIGLMYNFRDDLKKLVKTLSIIQDVLVDAEELQAKSQFVRNRIKELGEVLFDADDLLDEVATEDLRRTLDTRGKMARQVCDFFSSSSNHITFRRNMGHAISEIRDSLDFIANDISKFNFVSTRVIVNTQVGWNRKRETDSFVFEPAIIGRETERDVIIEKLLGSGSSNTDTVNNVIPIVGIGGLGKTALAKLVFNDERVVRYFEPRSWVCVSEDFDKQVIVRNFLKSISSDDKVDDMKIDDMNKSQSSLEKKSKSIPSDDKVDDMKIDDMDMNKLQSSLEKKLDGKRYLLVLDDVWNEDREKWKELEGQLKIGASGCKIVVTSRSVKVASAMGINSPYFLGGLSEEKSWEWFKQLAFEEGVEKVDKKIIEIGKEVIKRCKGLPLAIKALGSTMRSKTRKSEWLFIKNNEIWLSSLDDGGDILSVLKLSYDQLPTHLKCCFAYCSIFPKDYKIKYEMLIQLWMAQGYIQSSSSSGKSLESIGEQYFKDLLSISFFQEVELNEYGSITSVKMHDLIVDLAKQIVRTNYERVRHVFLQCDLKKVPKLLLEEKGTRTFSRPNGGGDDLKMGYFSQGTIISKFKCLRVLDLKQCGIKKLRDSIGSLKHLRYLDLSGNGNMKGLPNTIGKLLNLQTLNLSHCRSLVKLPRGITKLVNLRYLMMDECYGLRHMPSGMGKLTSLQQLSRLCVGKKEKKKKWELSKQRCGLRDLKDLNDLRGISIVYLERIAVADAAEESKEANTKEKIYLQSLRLHWGFTYGAKSDQQAAELVLEGLHPHSDLKEFSIEWYCGASLFASWMREMVNLVKLTIHVCLNCQQLQSLSQLPRLKFLSLRYLYKLEYIQEEEEEEYDDSNKKNQEVRDEQPPPSSSSSSSSSALFFLSLQELELRHMPELKGWWSSRRRESESESVFVSSSVFPRLASLSIMSCPMLTSMPLHPNLQELELIGASVTLLRERLTTITTAEEEEEDHHQMSSTRISSSSSSSLSKLKSLSLFGMKDLVALPQECLQNLTSLESLTIGYCDELASLPQELCCLTSLQVLRISKCPNLMERCKKETGEDWPKIAHIPNIIIDDEVIRGRKISD